MAHCNRDECHEGDCWCVCDDCMNTLLDVSSQHQPAMELLDDGVKLIVTRRSSDGPWTVYTDALDTAEDILDIGLTHNVIPRKYGDGYLWQLPAVALRFRKLRQRSPSGRVRARWRPTSRQRRRGDIT